jgi:FkbM family methyltransferase
MENVWLQEVVDIYQKYFDDEADIIIDLGTRDGDDAAFLAQKLNGKNIYALDAREDAIKLTKQRYPEFNVIKACISDIDGNAIDFYEVISDHKDYSGSSSIYNEKLFRPEYPHKVIRLKTMTMETFCRIYHIDKRDIDIIKVDIEGFTYQMLLGMKEKIYNTKLFHLETEKWSTHADHKNSQEVAEFMINHGFKLVSVQYEWGPDIEDQIWINSKLVTRNVLDLENL